MKSIGAERKLEGGEFAGFVGSSIDITNLKEAEDGLRKADRAKDEFLATLGHELRNPLAAISNASYLVASEVRDRNSASLGIIERQTRNMVRIVDDLLDVSRITHGKINLRLGPVNLEAIARDAIAATEHERRRLDQTIDVVIPEEAIWVLADAGRVEQIFTNLLGNASKFAPSGGRIGFSLRREEVGGERDAEAVVHIIDNGPGIDPAVLPRVFELFVQGERVDDRARTGVGIGLALARHLVSLHGGTIEARNLAAGGSELVVRLPTIAAPDFFTEEEEGAGSRPVQARRVVVVDDNADAAQAVGDMVSLLGHEVQIAGNGKGAIDIARWFQPDVMFLDLGLPDLDGYSVARQLRQDEQTRHITLVALTGYGRQEDVEHAHEAGFDVHLTKPAEPDALSRAIGMAGVPWRRGDRRSW
jgi:CheY-like chemotaxis protein